MCSSRPGTAGFSPSTTARSGSSPRGISPCSPWSRCSSQRKRGVRLLWSSVAEISEVSVTRARAERVRGVAVERFLTRGRVAGLLAFSLFALTFDLVKVQDDGTIYFDYLRRVFGVNTGGVAYQVGSAFWMAPFWLVSQAV